MSCLLEGKAKMVPHFCAWEISVPVKTSFLWNDELCNDDMTKVVPHLPHLGASSVPDTSFYVSLEGCKTPS